MNNGIWYAIVAYGLWGVLPIYWKLLHGVAEPEVISFRVLSSLVLWCDSRYVSSSSSTQPKLNTSLRML